ncbi:hypothetical protein QUB61_11440 [Microcoleus sp. C2D2]
MSGTHLSHYASIAIANTSKLPGGDRFKSKFWSDILKSSSDSY